MYGEGIPRPQKGKRDRKVSVIFRPTDGHQHCGGVNALALSVAGDQLFSAGRDFTVKRWDINAAQPALSTSYDGHTDWVNDVVVLDSSAIASCSSDRSIRLWRTSAGGGLPDVLRWHRDHVTSLSAAPQRGLLASGGLSAQVALWDVPTATRVLPKGVGYEPVEAEGMKESVYCVALNARGTVLACGSTDAVVRVCDPRTGSKLMKLRGHTDNVRALLVSEDGTLVLSGSSDHTMRLWDLGQQRCLQTFAVHTGSVWTLAADEAFTVALSGGLDKCIYRTQLSSRTSELVASEGAGVRSLAWEAGGEGLWAATAQPHIHRWRLAPDLPASPTSSGGGGAGRPFLAGASPLLRARQSMDGALKPVAQQQAPAATIRGAAKLVQCAVLEDRQHLLTRDAEGGVALWDITCGVVTQHYGKVDFEAKRRELFVPVSMATWFTADTDSGNLVIGLDPGPEQPCFAAEVYAADLGFADAPDDLKLNLGEQMLKGLFHCWAQRCGHAQPESPPITATTSWAAQEAGQEGRGNFQFWVGLPPVMASSTGDGRAWRRLTTQFQHMPIEGDVIPLWVLECVLRSRFPPSKDAKCAFILQPAEGSKLPVLQQARLNAPRILRVPKVAAYAIAKLGEAGVQLVAAPVTWDQPGAAALLLPSSPALELTCNGLAVPYDLSLAAVKQYIWKRTDDLVIQYRVLDVNQPAPLAPVPVSQ